MIKVSYVNWNWMSQSTELASMINTIEEVNLRVAQTRTRRLPHTPSDRSCLRAEWPTRVKKSRANLTIWPTWLSLVDSRSENAPQWPSSSAHTTKYDIVESRKMLQTNNYSLAFLFAIPTPFYSAPEKSQLDGLCFWGLTEQPILPFTTYRWIYIDVHFRIVRW